MRVPLYDYDGVPPLTPVSEDARRANDYFRVEDVVPNTAADETDDTAVMVTCSMRAKWNVLVEDIVHYQPVAGVGGERFVEGVPIVPDF